MGAERAEAVRPRRATGNRLECLAVLVVVGLVLVGTALLTPGSEAVGTRESVAPLPCVFRWLTGLPCPFCGMTTALTHMARGEVVPALNAHALGPLAYVILWLVGLRAVYGLIRRRPLLSARIKRLLGPRVVFGIALAGWVVNLVRVWVG